MENTADIWCVCVHTDVGKDVFSFDSRSFGLAQVAVTFACDLILHGEMHHCRAGSRVFTFPAQMFPRSQKRNILILSFSPSRTLTTCAHGSLLNDSVNVPHQRMSHSTTLLL